MPCSEGGGKEKLNDFYREAERGRHSDIISYYGGKKSSLTDSILNLQKRRSAKKRANSKSRVRSDNYTWNWGNRGRK